MQDVAQRRRRVLGAAHPHTRDVERDLSRVRELLLETPQAEG